MIEHRTRGTNTETLRKVFDGFLMTKVANSDYQFSNCNQNYWWDPTLESNKGDLTWTPQTSKFEFDKECRPLSNPSGTAAMNLVDILKSESEISFLAVSRTDGKLNQQD